MTASEVKGDRHQNFKRMMTVRCGEIHVGVAVMNPVNAPKHGIGMFETMYCVGYEIGPQNADPQRNPPWPVEQVQKAPPVLLRHDRGLESDEADGPF